ncbi:MAG: hypothetical protein AMXMBFR47_13230 [Planctomycetota bacterium]
MVHWIESQSDLAVFAAVVVIVAAGVTVWRLRRGCPGVTVWVCAAGLIGLAQWHVNRSAQLESDRFAREAAGAAAICAAELRAMGHASISLETSADDPDYLAMVGAQRRWQAASPDIHDIYTLRPTSDGRWVVLIDSESDLDRDGRYLGGRESRPAIGEELVGDPAFSSAWAGGVGFNPRPVNGRLLPSVTVTQPIVDGYGGVDGVLAIDYAARRWESVVAGARADALRAVSILGLIAFGALIGFLAMRDAAEERRRVAESLRRTQLDLTRAREASEQAARVKTEFLGNLSREMRTTVVDLLGALDAGAEASGAETARANGRQLVSLLDNIAELSRIESGRMSVEEVECSPIAIVRQVETMMRPVAEAAGVGFGVEFAGRLPGAMHSDPARLTQALASVCRHAISVSRAGDVKLVVGFSSGSGALQFDVVDTGPGLAPDQAADLLRPLGQASAVSAGGGRLNLCIALHLARLLGGDLRVVESRPAAGTRVRLVVAAGTFGAKLAEATSKPAERRADSAGERTKRGAILVAGDGPDRERHFRYILARAGYEVSVVDNGRAAIDSFTAASASGKTFDVVFLDIELPVINGYGTARSLRRLGFAGAIVGLASQFEEEEPDQALAAGCDLTLVKPVAHRLLLETVERLTAGRAVASTALS